MASVPGYTHLRYGGAAEQPSQQQLSPTLLDRLERVAEALHVNLTIFSGYRSDAYSATHGGFAGDPHTRHIAADVDVGSQTLGGYISSLGRNARSYLAGFGLRSGDQPGFYQGKPDPAHVDLVGEARRSGSSYGYTELMMLWTRAGGPKAAAPVMAAVALAESSGNPKAHLLTKREDSRGLWQINVRAHPDLAHGDLYNPQVNAQAAVAVYRSSGPGAWSTYTNGAYRNYESGAPDNSPIRVRPGGATGATDESDAALVSWYDWPKRAGEALVPGFWEYELASKLFGGTTDVFGALKVFFQAIIWMFNPRNWVRLVEFLAGAGLIVLGLVALVLNFLQKNDLPTPAGPLAKVATKGARRTRPRARRGRSSSRRGGGSLEEARTATERERGKEVRSRRRERIERARETRAEREKRERSAYMRGAADVEGFR